MFDKIMIQKTTRKTVQKLINKKSSEWPPVSLFGFYQPFRPINVCPLRTYKSCNKVKIE